MSLKTTILHNHKNLLILNNRLRKNYRTIINSNPKINSIKDGIVCFCLAKTYKTHGIVINLTRSGYVEDAEILTRTLFDLTLIISACLNDKTDETALKYLRFDYTLRSKMFRQLQDDGKFKDYFEERQKNPKPGDESIDEIQQKATDLINLYGGDFSQKWHSGLTTGELAKSVKLEKYFRTAFSLHSQLSHSLPRVMNRYLVDDEGELKIDVLPKDKEVDQVLVSAFNMGIIILDKFNEHYKILDEKILKKLVDDLVKAV